MLIIGERSECVAVPCDCAVAYLMHALCTSVLRSDDIMS
jgi:hypothetical protein